ncbi:MAG: RagB/SusD family nutrient uptake outer membrane protein [Ferruginibacter sp.]|nr:RagB/SusD family nutrient uptake outer membrane protein [Ferruginibacter sp.]
MKKIIIGLLIFANVATTISCKKFLEKPPEGSVQEADALKTEADVQALLNGCYLLLGNDQMYNGKLQTTAEQLADHLSSNNLGGKQQENNLRRSTIFNTDNADLFTGIYNIVYRTNKIIEKIELVSAANKPRIEAEARFIRAICHFEIARLWSHNPGYSVNNSHLGITIKTAANLLPPNRATVKETYDFIIAELKASETNLPTFNANRLYADKNCVRAFLARVYFQMNDFSNAYSYATQVINSTNYTFNTVLATRYTALGTTESILKTSNIQGQHTPGGKLREWFSGRGGLPYFRINDVIYSVFNSNVGDGRNAWLDKVKYPGNTYLNKYDSSNFEMPIIGITEMYLIRAEAAGEIAVSTPAALTIGIADINKIIERAYGNNTKNLALTVSPDMLINTVRNQREIEMIGEGDRLYQIKRIGAHPIASRRVERLDRRGSIWNCPGFILQFPDYEKNANAAFQLNVEGSCL